MIGDSETRRKKNSGADVCTWIDRKVRKLQFLSVDQYILDSEDRSDQAPAEKLLFGHENDECGMRCVIEIIGEDQCRFFHRDKLTTQMARLDWDIYWHYLRSIYIYAKLGRTHD